MDYINKIKNYFSLHMYKASWVMLVLFIIVAIGDFWSTLRVGELAQYLEANPVFKFIGFGGIAILNAVAIYFFLWRFHKSKFPGSRFMILSAFVYFTITRISVILSNIKIGDAAKIAMAQNPEVTIAAAKAITYAAKVDQTFWTITLGVMLPIVVSMLPYYLLQLDHKIEWRDEKCYQK